MIEFLSNSAVWGVALTLAAYALGVFLNKLTKSPLCNPLLLASMVLILFLSLCQIPYGDYKASAEPLTYLLLPATVSLAIPLYEQLELLKKNVVAILAGITAGVFTSILCIVALAWIFQMDYPYAVSLLPKSVTSAIGADVATELGGIASLTIAVIILTGIVGNILAHSLCKLLHITNPIAKGVAIGTSAHAIATAKALEMGKVEGAMSSLSIAFAGILTAILCPIFADLLP